MGVMSLGLSGRRGWMLVWWVELRTICHEANVLKAAVWPIAADKELNWWQIGLPSCGWRSALKHGLALALDRAWLTWLML